MRNCNIRPAGERVIEGGLQPGVAGSRVDPSKIHSLNTTLEDDILACDRVESGVASHTPILTPLLTQRAAPVDEAASEGDSR